MKALRFLVAFALALAGLPVQQAFAQTATVVSSCGGASYTVGQQYPLQQTATGLQCSSATLSGSVTVGNATITAPLGTQTGAASVATIVNSSVLPTGGSTSALQSSVGATAHTDAAAINTTLGTPMQATGGTVGLVAGSAIIGQSGIDQTTPGSTNGVTIAPSSAAAVGITSVISSSAESGHIIKGSPGNLYGVYATNFTNTSGWLVVVNSTTVPGDGAVVPLACAALPPNGSANISRAPGPPQVYSTGISAFVSSAANCFTKTTGVITAFISGDAK